MTTRQIFISMAVLCIYLAALLASPNAQAAPLLEEHFASATLDTNVWTTYNGDQWAVPTDIGGGDFALALTDSANGTGGVFGVSPYVRGENIRCTFKLWNNGNFQYTNVGGPWVGTNDPANQGWQYPTLNWVAAGICGQDNGDGSNFGWMEGPGIWNWLPLETAFLTAWHNATSKASALNMRVTLGDTFGARMEWSQNGVNWIAVKGEFSGGEGDIDTRVAPFTDGNNYYGPCTVSHQSPLWVGFAGGYNQPTYVDDIYVENDSHTIGNSGTPTPTPTPSPTPTPFPSINYPFNDNFETDPFAAQRWGSRPAGGIVQWATAQSASSSHAIYLERTASSYSYSNPALITQVNNIPQTGQFEVRFSFYFDFVDTSNYVHVLALGGNSGGAYSGLTFAVQSTSSYFATYYNGQAVGWDTGATTVIQNGVWFRVRTLINQDTLVYSVFLAQGNGAEAPYITDAPLGATLIGAAGNDYVSSFPFVQAKYYLDDVIIGPPGGTTPPVNAAKNQWTIYR